MPSQSSTERPWPVPSVPAVSVTHLGRITVVNVVSRSKATFSPHFAHSWWFPNVYTRKLYKIADVGLEGDGGARAELRSDQTRASFSRDGATIIICFRSIIFCVDVFFLRWSVRLAAPIRDATHELGTGQGRSGELWGGTRSFKQKRDFLLLYLTWEVPNPPQLGESIV